MPMDDRSPALRVRECINHPAEPRALRPQDAPITLEREESSKLVLRAVRSGQSHRHQQTERPGATRVADHERGDRSVELEDELGGGTCVESLQEELRI